MKLYMEPDSYFASLGLIPRDKGEWVNDEWTIEYMGTKERPYMWRIDDFNCDGCMILFLDIKTKSELEWLLKAVGAIE